ncbi:unnamed protein product [Symbiodinium sp. CCMP2592]|nr:unnamed protein product [Symbiodinium sp. CCMP2592]
MVRGSSRNQGGTGGDAGSVSKPDFVFAREVIAALQSIRDRSTSDLRLDDFTVDEDRTLIQAANLQASAVARATKRLEANAKAKLGLQTVLPAWLDKVGRHLAAIPRQINGVGAKIDADIQEAIMALDMASQGLVAGQAAALRQQATEVLGPAIPAVVGHEVLRLAAELRAAGAVAPPASNVPQPHAALPLFGNAEEGMLVEPGSFASVPASSIPSLDSSLGAQHAAVARSPDTLDTSAPVGTGLGRRWGQKRMTNPVSTRPSKSPRKTGKIASDGHTEILREAEVPSPWLSTTTGRSPTMNKPAAIFKADDAGGHAPGTASGSLEEEVVPSGLSADAEQGERDWQFAQQAWFHAWIAMAQRITAQGSDLVGDVPGHLEQVHLPGQPASADEIKECHQKAETLWQALRAHAEHPEEVKGHHILQVSRELQHLGHLTTTRTEDDVELLLMEQDFLLFSPVSCAIDSSVACALELGPSSASPSVRSACAPAFDAPGQRFMEEAPRARQAVANMCASVFCCGSSPHPTFTLADRALHPSHGPRQTSAALTIPALSPLEAAQGPIAVFVAGHTSGGPIQVAIDTRLHGVQLHRVILQLVGLSFQLWHVHELQTLLPALPLEQVVVIPNDVAWNQACIPVDLCALGGTISVVRGPRQQLASYFLVAAARSQDLDLDLASTVCRTRHGFFEPECQALLLHGNDALQALPVYAEEMRGSRSPAYSAEHRMAVSSFDGTNQGFELIVNPHARAVIITLTGLVFYDTDPFQDRDELLREAYEAVGDVGPLRLQRVRPHMPGLPPLQFAQAEQSALQVTYVVDARAIGGEISLVYLGPRTPVADVLMQLPTFRQAGPTGHEILRGLHEGHLRLIHQEVVISPTTFLDSDPPVCLTLVPHRRSHTAGQARTETATQPPADATLLHPGGNIAAPAPQANPSAAGWISLGLLRQGWLRNVLLAGYFASLVSAGRAASEPTDLTGTARTMPLPRFQPDLVYHDASMHLRLQQGFVTGLEGDFLPSVSGYGTLHHDLEVNVCLWAPEHFEEFRVPGSMSRHRLRETLTEKARSWGRGQVVPAATSPHALAVHFVAVTTESGYRTTLFASDTSCICIDVPREAPQDFLLRQCEAKLRSDCVRFLPMATPLRHGDVIRVELDKEFGRADASRFLLYSELARPSRWLDVLPYRQLAVVTVHRGVQILHDTVTGRSPHSAVQAWLRERNHVPRQAVEVPELSNLVGFPCFQTIVAGPTNAVLWLHDHFGNSNTGLALAAVGSFSVAVDVLEACARTSTSARAVCSLVSTADLRTVHTVHGLCAQGTGTKTLFVRMAFDLQALPGDSISVHRQRATVLRTRTPIRLVGSSRSPASRQGAAATRAASPVRSPSPRFAIPVCHPSHLQDADGDLRVIRCETDDVTCVVRCGPHMQIWALKIEGRWSGACTPQVSWDAVVSLNSLTPWDAADLVVTTEDQWWRYPQDLNTAAGRCLTLHQTCENGREVLGQGATPSAHQAASVVSVALWALGKAPLKWLSLGWILGVTARPAQQASSTSEESPNPNATDSEPSLSISTVAVEDQRDDCWNSPLTPALEASATAAMFPLDPQHVYSWLCSLGAARHDLRLWTAMRGPALVRWADTASEFDQALRLGGFCPEEQDLFVAADTDPYTLELVAVPRGQGSWWIVRDLLSRELLELDQSFGFPVLDIGWRSLLTLRVKSMLWPITAGARPSMSTISLVCLLFAGLPGVSGAQVVSIGIRPGRQFGLVAMWLLDVEVWTGNCMQQTVQIPQARVYTAIRIWIVDHPSPIQLSGPPWPTEEEIHGIVQLGGFGVERGILIPIRGAADSAVYDAAYVPLHFGHSGIVACLVQLEGRAAVFAFDAQHFDWAAFGRWVADVFRDATQSQSLGFSLGNCGYSYGQAVQRRNGDLVVLHYPRPRHTAYLAPPDPWALESPPPLPARMLQTGPTRGAPINAYLLPQGAEGVGISGHRRWALNLAVGPSPLQPALPAGPAGSTACGVPAEAVICPRNSYPSLQACSSLVTQRHAAIQTEPGTATLDDVWWAIQDMQCQLAALAAQAHVPAAEGLPSAEVTLLQGRGRDGDNTPTFRGTENSGSLKPALLVPGVCLFAGVALQRHSAARTWVMPLAFLLPIWGAPTLEAKGLVGLPVSIGMRIRSTIFLADHLR